ncbi:MAG: hypothetical protein R3E84_16190 [Pseudomonadales bacterium]
MVTGRQADSSRIAQLLEPFTSLLVFRLEADVHQVARNAQAIRLKGENGVGDLVEACPLVHVPPPSPPALVAEPLFAAQPGKVCVGQRAEVRIGEVNQAH